MAGDGEKPEKIVTGETGLQENLGYEHHIFADRCETHLVMDGRHTNRHGGLHGGLHSVLLDSACGFAASRALSDDAEQLVVTLSQTTNFLAVSKDLNIRTIGRVTRAGRSVVYATGEVYDGTGKLLSTGSCVFKKVG